VAQVEGEDRRAVFYQSPLSPRVYAECQRYITDDLEWIPLTADEFQKQVARAYDTSADIALEALTDVEEDLDSMMTGMPKTQDLLQGDDDAPIIRLINAILTKSIKQSASDVHFETFEDDLMVRFRVDGMLHEALKPPRALAALLTSRLKIMSQLDIAEKRLPQDGRIALKIAGRTIDVRVSTLPTHHGERIVLRLLDKENAPLDLKLLGMSEKPYSTLLSLIKEPHGIILVTGPTGSGKTTTLYGVLNALNQPTRNVMTVEDPIEYYLPGIGQTQVNTKVDMTFARGLRTILRQDPDVVMVGEIRDLETAEMAVQASLTGHLVLSTLHTNSALGALTRLRDMGIERFLIASSLIGVAAQRLVRTLCPHCKKPAPATASELEQMGIGKDQPVPTIYSPKGCDECYDLGYQGRTGIYEVIAIDSEVREALSQQLSSAEVEAVARKNYPSMREDGWRRVLAGEIPVSEVLRVTSEY
jgi:general secretion pathway protein E